MPYLFVSTVGTSLLTNYVNKQRDQDLSLLFRDTANAKEKELTSRQRDTINEIITRVDTILENAADEELPQLSAELRGSSRLLRMSTFTPRPPAWITMSF